MKNVLGLISNKGKGSYASYYEREAYDFYDEVVYIDPRNVEYTVCRGGKSPEVVCEGRNLNDLSMAYVLSPPTGTWKHTILLVKYLMATGCPISDSFNMFRRDGIGKAYEALASQHHVGTTSYIACSLASGTKLVENLNTEDFPLVTKPAYGQHGKGIEKVENARETIRYLQRHFKKTKDFLLLEKFITYVREWRIYVVDGNIIGSYGKSATPGSFIANLHHGAKTSQSEDMEDVYTFVKAHLPEQCTTGIYGLDVGLSSTGDIHVIETNRCPGWKGLKGTGVNFPYEANKILFRRARKFNNE